MQVLSTKGVSFSAGINILLYGRAGIGKTVLCGGIEDVLIINVENGLLSLSGKDVPYVEASSLGDLVRIGQFLRSEEGSNYKAVCLDSFSAICNLVFEDVRVKLRNDPRVVYPAVRDRVLPILSAFMSLDQHFVVTMHETVRCETSIEDRMYVPLAVGNKLTDDLPYLFDIVLHYNRSGRDRVLVSEGIGCIAKDKSGRLPSTIKVSGNGKELDNIISTVIGFSEDEE